MKNKLTIIILAHFIIAYYSTIYCQDRKPINLSTYHLSLGLSATSNPGMNGIVGLSLDFNNNLGLGVDLLISKIRNRNVPENFSDPSEFFDLLSGGILMNSSILKFRYHFQSLEKTIRSNVSFGPLISQIKYPEFIPKKVVFLESEYSINYLESIYKFGFYVDYKVNFTRLRYYGIELGVSLLLIHRQSSIGLSFAHTFGKLKTK